MYVCTDRRRPPNFPSPTVLRLPIHAGRPTSLLGCAVLRLVQHNNNLNSEPACDSIVAARAFCRNIELLFPTNYYCCCCRSIGLPLLSTVPTARSS